MKQTQPKGRGVALIPMLVFLVLFLGTGLYLNAKGVEFAFYQLPAPVAAMVGLIVAFLICRGTLNEKFDNFVRGAGESNIITMCIIYLLAGALATVAKEIGGVDSTVNLGLSLIPPALIMPGLFMIAAFVSTAMGTSMGTIAAVAPIAVGMAMKAGLSMPLTIATVIGGSMFGDNLSMISDTTIAATKTQGCEMKDKFKTNFKMALPAALITMVILAFIGGSANLAGPFPYELIKVMPYVLVLVLALTGMNVFVVLTLGILVAGGIGVFSGQMTLMGLAKSIYSGFTGMQEIFILSMLIGGLAEMIKADGGIDFLLNIIRKRIKTQRGAELGIGALVSVADICTANNTIAIILAGPMAKEISDDHKVDPKISASILDIFSCVWQGFLPYSAQILLAGSLAKLSPLEIIPFLFYQYLLAIVVLGIIFFGKRVKVNPDTPLKKAA